MSSSQYAFFFIFPTFIFKSFSRLTISVESLSGILIVLNLLNIGAAFFSDAVTCSKSLSDFESSFIFFYFFFIKSKH